MYTNQNVFSRFFNWRKCMVTFGLASFALLLIFGNFKSQSFYEKQKAAKKEMLQNDSQVPSIQAFQLFSERPVKCLTYSNCTITCSGNMEGLNYYLRSQKSCSFIALLISDATFPQDELQSNWLEGSFHIKSIKISQSKLNGILDGAFNQQAVASLSELELHDVQLPNLTENSFEGLRAITKFTLVNRIDQFSGEAFLKPMMNTLKTLVIKHVTNIATDPGPWLRGESFPQLTTVILDGSNFGGYINAATFGHFKKLTILTMNSCRITSIADGSFDFMMIHMGILISLVNNQLTRLDGEYLSTITSIRRINIQNNPWDCTCKLEHLARAFKDHPEFFGGNSRCSSPNNLAGKLLNEINLSPCEDETSFPSEPTTSSGKDSTALISSSIVSPSSKTLLKRISTPSSQKRTPTLSADSIFIQCARHKARITNYPPNVLELSPPDGYFKIISISDTSIRLILEGPSDGLAIIWFCEQPGSNESYGSVRIVGQFNVGCQSELDKSLLVEGLVANQSYTFCLVKNVTKEISPFNCRSHFSNIETVVVSETVWLRKKDRPLAIGVFVACILVSIVLGLIGMFLLIRLNACLLRSSEQIGIGDKITGENGKNIKNSITDSSFGNSFYSDATTRNVRRFSAESGLSYMMANNYEELEYCRRMNANYDLMFSNRVPRSPAPPLPTRINDFTKARHFDKRKIHGMEQNYNDDGYTSVV